MLWPVGGSGVVLYEVGALRTVAALPFFGQHSPLPGCYNPVNHPFGIGRMPERGLLRSPVVEGTLCLEAPSPFLQACFAPFTVQVFGQSRH